MRHRQHAGDGQMPIEMREEITAARGLPDESLAQILGLDRQHDQISLAGEVATRGFGGQTDLVVLAIEADDLGQALVWEASRGGDLFPHLYGHLPVTRVLAVTEAPLAEDGVPQLGELA